MRHWLARQMHKPWVTAIGCTAIFVTIMGALRYGMSALKATGDRPLILTVCGVGLAVLFLIGWLMERAGIGRE